MSEIFLNRYVYSPTLRTTVLVTYYPNPATLGGVNINAGTYQDVVYGTAVPWTVTNLGTLGQVGSGTFGGVGNGVDLRAGGTVINGHTNTTSAYIYSAVGGHGVKVSNGAGTVDNYGTISATDPNSQARGVYLTDSGVVNNGLGGATGATIDSSAWAAVGIYGTFAAVTNAGTITGGSGVSLGDALDSIDGSVTNEQSGYIYGNESGVYINDATATVTNLGTISGYRQGGVIVGGGTVTNGSTTDTTALIAGGRGVKGGDLSVSNYGTINAAGNISGRGNAVYITGNGGVYNGSHGLIIAYHDGVFIDGTGTVTNLGSIGGSQSIGNHSSGAGVRLGAGLVYNGAGGVITGDYYSIAVEISHGPGTIENYGTVNGDVGISGGGTLVNGSSSDTTADIAGATTLFGFAVGIGGTGTVVNYGTIAGNSNIRGIWLQQGGSVINGAPGSTVALIQGDYGVDSSYPSTVTNFGTILGTRFGVQLGDGGVITNGGSGSTNALIEGPSGIRMLGTVGTAVNFGTIDGTSGIGIELDAGGTLTSAGTISGANGTAASFGGSGGDRLIIDPGAVFVGQVVGAGATDTIELAGTAAGTITGIGTSFTGFGSVDIDAGAQWRLVAQSPSAGVLFGGATISGFGTADKFDLTGIGDGNASAAIVGSQLDIKDNGQDYLVNLANPSSYAGESFIVTADSAGGIAVSLHNSPTPPVVEGKEIFLNRYVSSVLHTYYPNPTTLNVINVNPGTYQDAVYGTAEPWTVTNLGTLGQVGAGTFPGFGNGVDLRDGGTVINGQTDTTSAYIYSAVGGDAVKITNGAGTVDNYGTISATYVHSQAEGVFLGDSGVVNNGLGGATGATINTDTDFSAIQIYGTSAAVTNAGTITGGSGVSFGGFFDSIDGSVTNDQSGYIDGHETGVYINDSTATVTNLGTIIGYRQGGVIVAGGTVVNGSTTDTTAVIAGGRGVKGGNLSVSNYGTIDANGNFASRGNAVYITGGGSVFNGSHGLITAATDGVQISSFAGTVANYGSIYGGRYGVNLYTGSVSNGADASITGGNYAGINFRGASGTVTNYGSIVGPVGDGTGGVGFAQGGTLVNGSAGSTSALIKGGNFGVQINGTDAVVTNFGTIESTNPSWGVLLNKGGIVTNGAGSSTAALMTGDVGVAVFTDGGTVTNFGTIEGTVHEGVLINASGTVVNAGTISGANGTAVNFGGSGGDRLVVDPGAVFVGQVAGAGATDTIELAGTAAGTIIGIGSSFTGFGSVDIDAGAQWSLVAEAPSTGVLFGGDTVSGFGAGDKIDLTGIGDSKASAAIVGSQLDIKDNGQDYLVNLANPSSYTGDTFTVTADSAGGILVGLTAANNAIQVPGDNTETDFQNNDTIDANSGNDTISTFGQSDVINAGSGFDVINVFGQDSTVHGGTGPDAVNVFGAGSTIVGDGGNDVVALYSDGNTVIGGSGFDTISVFGTGNSVAGGTGPETITVYNSADTVTAGSGNAVIGVYANGDSVVAGSGFDTITVFGNADTVAGGSGPDTINVFGQDNRITAAGGNAQITVFGADDTVTGGSGSDTITVSGNNDAISGTTGPATISVSGDFDTVSTGSGPETLSLSGANDTVQAGAFGNTTAASITLSGSSMIFADGSHTYADTVTGFSEGAGDTIKLSNTGHTVASSNQVNGGADTLITLSSGSTILLKGVTHVDNSFFS